MLKQLKSTKTSAIIDDKVYALLRNGNKTHLYRDLNIELRYFYKFVRDKHLVPYAVEYDIEDSEFRRVGRVNALFRIKRYKYADDKLMLYDWMRSRYMIPGSLTWMKKTIQMNIYKYILEKFYYKKIVKMVVVVLHRDNDKSTYEQIKIDDIGFRFDAQPMAKRGKKEKKWNVGQEIEWVAVSSPNGIQLHAQNKYFIIVVRLNKLKTKIKLNFVASYYFWRINFESMLTSLANLANILK